MSKRRNGIALVLGLLLVWGAGGPASGRPSGDEDSPEPVGGRPGPAIEVGVEPSWVAIRNLDLDYAFVDESGNLGGGGIVRTLGYDRDSALRYSLAWRFAKPGSPTLHVDFWELEAEGDSSTGLFPSNVGALLASPILALGGQASDSATASSEIQATQGDVYLTWRPRLGDRMTMEVAAGIRGYRFEEATAVIYAGDGLEERITIQGDAKGLGPRTSVAFEYEPTRRLRCSARLGLALPVGEVERFLSDVEFQTNPLTPVGSVVVNREGDRRATTQLEGGLRIEWWPIRRLLVTFGYEYMVWSDVRVDLRLTDVVSPSAAAPSEHDAVFEGPSLGLRYTF